MFRLFLEITVEEAFEAFAVASFVLGHHLHCVVDGVEVGGFCIAGNAHLVGVGSCFGVHTLFKVGLGVPYYVAEENQRILQRVLPLPKRNA